MKKISFLFSIMLFALQSLAQQKGIGVQFPIVPFSAHHINVSYYRQSKNGKRLNSWFLEPIVRINRRKDIDTFGFNPPIVYNVKSSSVKFWFGHQELFRIAHFFDNKASAFLGIRLYSILSFDKDLTTSNQGINSKRNAFTLMLFPKAQVSYKVTPKITFDIGFENNSVFLNSFGMNKRTNLNIPLVQKENNQPFISTVIKFSPRFDLSIGMRYKLWEKKEKIKKKKRH